MEDIVPDFLGIAIDKIPLDDLISLSETNKTWNTWMRNNLNNVAGKYNLPYAKSIDELVSYTWSLEAKASARVK